MFRHSVAVAIPAFLLLFVLVSPPVSATGLTSEYPAQVGPFLDKLVYKVMEGDDQQVLALINDEIDLIGDMVDPSFLQQLDAAENVDVENVLRNGYGYLVIKTDKYPLNITSFRRAFAFALDKESICDDIWEGLAVPIDSCLPAVNPFSIEGQLPYTYYEANVALGNQLLDDAGFEDIDEDGFREAPNGSEFEVVIECASSSAIALQVGSFAADALQTLHIDAVSQATDFYEYLNRLYFHGDFDMVYLGASFTSFDVDWLAYEFWGDYADVPYWNFPCWQNATYDSWRDQLLYATSHEDVYEAAIAMQEIWIHACPEVICYENMLLSAYRTDKFEGHVNSDIDGIPGWWTNYKVHLKDSEGGPVGGQFRLSNSLDVDTFNFMASSSAYTMNVLNNLYDSLIRQDPQGSDMLWLAESYIAETHADNPAVPSGHTRFTFTLFQNATWTDGTPLTGEDVAFSLNYYASGPGNPYGADLTELTAAYSPTTYSVVAEFSTESYWHLHTIGYKPIIPKHVFEVIGVNNWNIWDPDPPEEEMVTSGPFNISEYVAGEFVELTYNPSYFRGISHEPVDLAPTLDQPMDVTYHVGESGNQIVWHAYDTNPATYVVFRNESVHDSGVWDGGDITVNVSGLGVGSYNFTLWVYDSSANKATSTVWVYVLPPDPAPTLDQPADVTYYSGESGNQIVWHANDTNPATYVVFRNESVHDSGVWDGGDIIVDVDGLDVGSYNFTLWVFDNSTNYAASSVWVYVLRATTTATTTTTTTTSETTSITEVTTTSSTTTGGLDFGPLSPLSLAITGAALLVVVVLLLMFLRRKP